MYRYKGKPVCIEEEVSGLYYLILVSPEQGSDRYELRTEPGRTNSSHAIKYEGWLGSTNNVSRYAEGAVELYMKDGRPRIKPVPVERLFEVEEIGDAE